MDTLFIPINRVVNDGGQAFLFKERMPKINFFMLDTVAFYSLTSKHRKYQFEKRIPKYTYSFFSDCNNKVVGTKDSILFNSKYTFSEYFIKIAPKTKIQFELMGAENPGYEYLSKIKKIFRNLRYGKPKVKLVLNLLCADSIFFIKSKKNPSKIFAESNYLKY